MEGGRATEEGGREGGLPREEERRTEGGRATEGGLLREEERRITEGGYKEGGLPREEGEREGC